MIWEFVKKHILKVVIALGLVLLGYSIFRSREGFQNTTTTDNKDSPATCAMMNLIVERAQKNLQAAQQIGDANGIKTLQTSLDSILAEKNKMSC
jgi:hypothetical protein